MVTAAGLVELIGPWATGADPLNEQLADALTRAIETACSHRARASPPNASWPRSWHSAEPRSSPRMTDFDSPDSPAAVRSGTRAAARDPACSP